MSDPSAYVYVDLEGTTYLVGRLWTRATRGNQSASFQYAPEWLANPASFALEPGLRIGKAAHHTAHGRALFGALGDSAPDRWGRTLINRAERRRASAEAIVSEVAQAVATWRNEAVTQGLSTQEIDRMASAFDHNDLQTALKT